MSCHSTTKSGSRILEKIHKIWMMMVIVAGLIWAGAAKKRENLKVALKNKQTDSNQVRLRQSTYQISSKLDEKQRS